MPEIYRGYELNVPKDKKWGMRENTFHKQLIDSVLDGGVGSQGPRGATGAQGTIIPLDSDGKIPVSELDHVVRSELSTGLIEGGVLSINTDNTKYDVTAGHGHIVDYWTDPNNTTVIEVQWNNIIGKTPDGLLTQDSTYVAINSSGAITEYDDIPTNEIRREVIWLGKIIHRNRTNIVTASTQPDHSLSTLSQLRDLITAIKFINIEGNVISAASNNLTLYKSPGLLFGNGINYEDNIKNPHTKIIPTQNPITFAYLTQLSGYTSGNLTSVIPNKYDLNGVITDVPSNRYSNQRIYLFPSGNIRIQYGQYIYNSLSNAIAGIENETFIVNNDAMDNAILVGILSIRSICTDLTDITDARFIPVTKFGEVVSGAGTANSTTLQKAYDNSTEPEIITNSTLGAVTFKDGTGVEGANVIEIQNNAGTVVAYIDENGVYNGSVSGSSSRSVVSVSTTYTASIGQLVLATVDSAYTITLPTAISSAGKEITIKKVAGNFPLTVATTSSQTIDGDITITIGFAGTSIDFISDGSNWVIK